MYINHVAEHILTDFKSSCNVVFKHLNLFFSDIVQLVLLYQFPVLSAAPELSNTSRRQYTYSYIKKICWAPD